MVKSAELTREALTLDQRYFLVRNFRRMQGLRMIISHLSSQGPDVDQTDTELVIFVDRSLLNLPRTALDTPSTPLDLLRTPLDPHHTRTQAPMAVFTRPYTKHRHIFANIVVH